MRLVALGKGPQFLEAVAAARWRKPGIRKEVQGTFSGAKYHIIRGTVVSSSFPELDIPKSPVLHQYAIHVDLAHVSPPPALRALSLSCKDIEEVVPGLHRGKVLRPEEEQDDTNEYLGRRISLL